MRQNLRTSWTVAFALPRGGWIAVFAISMGALGASFGLRPRPTSTPTPVNRAALTPEGVRRIVADVRDGDRAAANGDLDAARRKWTAARGAGAGWWPVHRWLAVSYATAGLRREAEAEYAVAQALLGASDPNERVAICVERAANLEALGRRGHALGVLLETDDACVLPELERVAAEETALIDLLRDRAATRPELWRPVANAYERVGRRRDSALAFARHAICVAPFDRRAVDTAVDHLEREDLIAEALAVCRAHMPFATETAGLYVRMGGLLKRTGRVEEAAVAYTSIVDLEPQSPDAHQQLASLLGGLGRFDDAVEELAVVRRLNPERVLAEDVRAMLRPAPLAVAERLRARAHELRLLEP